MMGHKICFKGEIWLIIPKLSLLPLLIWTTDLINILKAISFSAKNKDVFNKEMYILEACLC